MGKPFQLTQDQPTRDPNGRFMPRQPVAPAPPQIVDESRSKGISVDRMVAIDRVPDHPTDDVKVPGAPNREQNPWPPASTGHKPMRVG